MKTIRYSLNGAYNSGINLYPMDDMKKMGVKVLSFEGVPIGDCCIMEVDKLPEPLPDYIEIIEDKN